ncbi:DegT/DnrJ/EryC1/StrS family aminotransferase [Shewanella sp.]|uniref:DegT/DnrJ/EryC1/StrS family aminotransferase n=1 Tax=Shewanella sp. TaxID=50422 RepID=UPI004047CFE8
MKIDFLDLKSTYFELKNEIDQAIATVLANGNYILGESVNKFEEEWASYCGSKYSVSVGNGLDSIYLALLAMDVGPGDEVIVPSNTFIATWLAVSRTGAKIVPVEPDEITFNIEANKIEAAITCSTKVIIPVHLFGHPADLHKIINIAKARGIYVLEDAAQAHGASYKGKKIGSHGDVVAWSFYPGKNLGCFGDGGAVTTNNKEIADKIKVLRNYGSNEKYVHNIQGFNSRLDPIQAEILSVKLKYLDQWNARRILIAKHYFSNIESNLIKLPVSSNIETDSWHLFVIKAQDRSKIREYLNNLGISTMIHYPIIPAKQKAYGNDLNLMSYNFDVSIKLSNEILSIPIGPHLSESNASYISDAINLFR